jgi:hypothetical protein
VQGIGGLQRVLPDSNAQVPPEQESVELETSVGSWELETWRPVKVASVTKDEPS